METEWIEIRKLSHQEEAYIANGGTIELIPNKEGYSIELNESKTHYRYIKN